MRRRMFTALAATVALPMLATPVHAQQDRGYGYSPSDDAAYHWSESRNAIERDRQRMDAYAGRGGPPNPPRTPDRYITDWDQAGQRQDYHDYYAGRGGPPMPPHTPDRYITDWDERGDYDRRRYADDRWADRDPPGRTFDRPSPPPGYTDEPGYPYRGYRFEPYADYGWREAEERERAAYRAGMRDQRMREMHRRHHDGGYEDLDFRRDFAQDGRRGYYQDPAYEDMAHGRQRMGAGPGELPDVDMREIRQAMRLIDRFDVDKDGRVTQREVDQYRSDRLSQFDTDEDDQLTLDEYAALWADAMRERMVRRFQRHDRDGDGLVSLDEFSAATRDVVRMRDRNRDDALSEDDFMRPTVAAPMGGSPNEPAQSRVEGDDDVADYDTRPEVEAPIEGTPNEPAGAATMENGDSGEDEETPESTTN